MRRPIIRPRLLEDIDAVVAYIENESPHSADRFIETVKSALQALSEMPEMGAPREFSNPRLGRLRFWPIRGFERYIIFYRVTSERIEFLRLLHSARDIPRVLDKDFPEEP